MNLLERHARITRLPVKIPLDLIQRMVCDLAIGESAWTVPWAMEVDQDGHCWLDVTAPVFPVTGGTVCAHITVCQDGVRIDVYPANGNEQAFIPRALDLKPGHYAPVVDLQVVRSAGRITNR